ncbi:MAG: 5'-3' exonuclease H3TH domain-containing protein [Acidimicrobiales bacterium]
MEGATADGVQVHLVDGTFELFRCFHGAPRVRTSAGREVGAARGVLATLVSLLRRPEVTHVAVAFDSVVAPAGSSRGTSPEQLIAAQAPLAADAVRALGLPVWPTGRYQADEMLATAAARFADHPDVSRVVICSSDNDFDQCVRGERVVVLDRIRDVVTDEAAVRARYGVAPQQVPELFALVGDRSDGLPGVPGWGLTSSAALLQRYGTVAAIPLDPADWDVRVRGRERLAASLREHRDEAILCRDVSELRTDLPLRATLDQLQWRGARRDRLDALCAVLEDRSAAERIERWRD